MATYIVNCVPLKGDRPTAHQNESFVFEVSENACLSPRIEIKSDYYRLSLSKYIITQHYVQQHPDGWAMGVHRELYGEKWLLYIRSAL